MLLPDVRKRITLEEGARVKLVIDNTSCSTFSSSAVKAKLWSLLTTFPKNMVVDIIKYR